jgi:hypothetical protein
MKKIKNILLLILAVIVLLFVGFCVPYIIQFKLSMFGSNYISIGDVVGLWVTCAGIGIVFSLFIFCLSDYKL